MVLDLKNIATIIWVFSKNYSYYLKNIFYFKNEKTQNKKCFSYFQQNSKGSTKEKEKEKERNKWVKICRTDNFVLML